MQQSSQSKMDKRDQINQVKVLSQQQNSKYQKNQYQQNKENNSQFADNNTRILSKDLQQSTVIEQRIGSALNEEDSIIKKSQKEIRGLQKQGQQIYSQILEQTLRKGVPQTQQEQIMNESGVHRNMINSGSISSSFCIPQAAHNFQQQLNQQIISINNSDFVIGSLQQSNFMNNINETLDSNGNEIRGRKIDSPHLIVVREIKELEEEEERDQKEDQIMHGFGSGSDELINLIWNSRDQRQQQSNMLNESLKKQSRQIKPQSKSLETKAQMQRVNIIQKTKEQEKSGKKFQHSNSTQKYNQLHQRGGGMVEIGTKSQRELRTSMGFNELLTQLDKDVSVNNMNLNDFKNRTAHDLLKLELSGFRKQNSKSGLKGGKADAKSKSIGKTGNQHQKQGTNKQQLEKKKTRSKSKEGVTAKKTEQVRPYSNANFNNSKNDLNLMKKEELDKLIQFIKQQTKTSQESLSAMNGRTKSQNSLVPSGSGQFKCLNNLLNQQKQNQNMQSSQVNQSKIQKDQSSPDRQINKDFKAIGNIDKLIRDNIKKNREKEDEERFMKLKIEETNKKKKEDLERKNSQVRLNNKLKTYKKNSDSHNLMQQQSQDPLNQGEGVVGMLKNKIILKKDWKDQIQTFNNFKMEFPSKSQSQKIDFEKIRSHQARGKRLTFKNHRKSYGLEFLDIKKEIEEELRTLDVRVKGSNIQNNGSGLIKKRNGYLNQSNVNKTETSIKKLKIKSSSKKKTTQGFEQLNEGTDKDIIIKRGFLEKGGHQGKVVVIKKNKIRKFMQAKKKEMIQQQWQQYNEEISRTMKMQENLNKLNQFCKKNLEKQHVHKQFRKRNITIQGGVLTSDPDLSDQNRVNRTIKDASKISQRKKDKLRKDREERSQKKKRMVKNEEEIGESSKLSTEFYEEYFRLINSIKKEQQESSSKIFLSENDLNGSNFTQIQRQLLKSPQNSGPTKQLNQNYSQSPSAFAKNQNQKKNSALSPSSRSHSGKSNKNQMEKGKQSKKLIGDGKLKKQQSQNYNEMRREKESQSAGRKKQQKQQKGGQLSNQKQEIVDIKNLRMESTESLVPYQNQMQGSDMMKQLMNDQGEFQIIQSYQYDDDDDELGSSDDEGNEEAYQTQILDPNVLHQDGPDERTQHIDDLENYEEEGIEDQESDMDDDEDQQLIIINQQPVSDENKIIYMSNINSCSLPQTPKEEQKKQQEGTLINEASNKNEQNKKIFEYKEQFKQDSQSMKDNVIQSKQMEQISKKMMLEKEEEKEQMTKSQKIIPKVQPNFNLQIEDGDELEEESKEINQIESNYGMRLFTGSESLLREFKLHTPKSSNPTINLQEQILKSQSVNEMASQVSQYSIGNINNQVSVESRKSVIANQNENTSQSSQSLFDRNSFQQFTMQKLNQLIQNNEFSNLISMREKALEYRQKKESKFIKKMYKNNQISPRTYQARKEQLEKWVQLEQEEIIKSKKAFQEEWQKTVQMIEQTQKNVEQMREKMKISIDNNKYHQGIFNSQSSRNSSSNHSNIASVKQEVKRQLNIEDFIGHDLHHGKALSSRSMVNEMKSARTEFNDIQSQIKIEEELKAEEFSKKNISSQQALSKKDENENLFEFLEQSWQKQKQEEETQLNQKSKLLGASNSQLQSSLHRNERASKQGIYIEDQNDKVPSSEISDTELNEMGILQQFNKVSSLNKEEEKQVDERSLHRSRSEQDLKELIRQNRVEDEEELSYGYEDNYLMGEGNKGQIIIQENRFDDQLDENDQKESFYQNIDDMESNGSCLNESDLNKYFQDQQFSIEDFKSLDKKHIIQKHGEEQVREEEEETARLLKRQEELDQEQLQSHHQISVKHIIPGQEEDNFDDSINKNQSDKQKVMDQFESEQNSGFQQPFYVQSIEYQKNRPSHTPDIISSSNQFFPQQQANVLFQNAKPGENIKIADILRGAQSLNGQGLDSLNSFMMESSNNNNNSSSILFQNQQINQNLNQQQQFAALSSQQDQLNVLANQITEDLYSQILKQVLTIPQRPEEDQGQNQGHQLLPQTNQIENQDIFIIDAQMNEREQRREQIELRQRQLIEADLQKAEIYINEIIGTLLQSELQALTQSNIGNSTSEIQNYHQQFLGVLTNPIKRNELDVLNQLQTAEIGSYEHFETTIDQTSFPILPIDLYLEIERQREEQVLQSGPNNMQQNSSVDLNIENSVVQESVHIHNKAVFDALNESLMKFRPYGLSGEPMPWSNKIRRLQTRVDANSVDTERLFQMVKQDVLRWIATYAGCQPSPVFVFRKTNSNQVTNNSQIRALLGEQEMFDEEQYQETRERRLAQMLASEVIETEHQWLNYEFEEAQVKIDLSDMILEHLVEEVVLFLNDKTQFNK